jgi:hypothetical protein
MQDLKFLSDSWAVSLIGSFDSDTTSVADSTMVVYMQAFEMIMCEYDTDHDDQLFLAAHAGSAGAFAGIYDGSRPAARSTTTANG